MHTLSHISYLIFTIYFLLNLTLVIVWLLMPQFKQKSQTQSFSVIVPVRNEATHIVALLQSLENQHYPKNQYEVWIMNDASTDQTADIVRNFQKTSNLNLHLILVESTINNPSPKKRAIATALPLAQFDTIVCTDGDCELSPDYLGTLSAFYDKTNAYFVSMPVTFKPERHLFAAVQSVEFGSLIGTGACSMFLKKPNMCNGANLSYRKWVFEDVDGFKGNENLASGDDEFLMHKVAKRYPDKVQFLKSNAVVIQTQAHENLKSFFNQRKRWGSKWKHYDNWQISALAIFVFLSNLLAVGMLIGLFISTNRTLYELAFLKFSAEFIFLASMLNFFGKQRWFWLIPLVQIVYPFYVSFSGLLAQSKQYQWKGRTLK